MTRHLYFAFGSNLSIEQMGERCPSSRARGPAVLGGHRIGFAGASRSWGGGIATIAQDDGHSVPGLLYSLTDRDLAKLDRCEGHPVWYRRERVAVEVSPKVTAMAWTYILREECNAPSDRYLRTIAEGYAMISDVVTDEHRAQLAQAAERAAPAPSPFDSCEPVARYSYAYQAPSLPEVEAFECGEFRPYRFADRVVEALYLTGRHDDAERFYLEALAMMDIDDGLNAITDLAERYVDVSFADFGDLDAFSY